MRLIYIGFSKPKKFKLGSWLISKWINKPYSHTFVRYVDQQDRDLVFQAAHGTVHQILACNFEDDNHIIDTYELEITDQDYEQLRDIFYSQSGKLYSVNAIIAIPIYDTLLKFGINFKSKDDSGYVCSELIGLILDKICGFKFDKPYNLLRPDDIEKALEKMT